MHDFMKTILSALKEWVNKRIKNNTPNWNENDPEADGYIKNRPFYTKNVRETLVDNVSIEIIEKSNPSVNMLTLDNIIEGQTYNIIWNDTEYNCIAYIAEGPNTPSLGNGAIGGAGGGNGEPFFITVFQGELLLFAEVGTHRISITTNSVEVKKIPKEYLPEEIPNINLVNGSAEGSLRTIGSAVENAEYTMGEHAFATGVGTMAFGESSHAEGDSSRAIGFSAHAEGSGTYAEGGGSHAEGGYTYAVGLYSHAQGSNTGASGFAAHAEGYSSSVGVRASGVGQVYFLTSALTPAQGKNCIGAKVAFRTNNIVNFATITNCSADYTILELDRTLNEEYQLDNDYITIYFDGIAAGDYSHSEGLGTIAASEAQHVQGKYNIKDAINTYAHIVGNGTDSDTRSNAHTLSWDGTAWFQGDVYVNSTSGTNRDEGSKKLATEEFVTGAVDNFEIPNSNLVNGNTDGSLRMIGCCEESDDYVMGESALALGIDTRAEGDGSVSEGMFTIANGLESHAAGLHTYAGGDYAYAGGYYSSTTAEAAYAMGTEACAHGRSSHAEGQGTVVEANFGHAEGIGTVVTGFAAHGEGDGAFPEEEASHAEGRYTNARGLAAHAEGYGEYVWLSITGGANTLTYTYTVDEGSDTDIYPGTSIRAYTVDVLHDEDSYLDLKFQTAHYKVARVVSVNTSAKTITLNKTLSSIALDEVSADVFIGTVAHGDASHAEGYSTIAGGFAQHVEGSLNAIDPDFDPDDTENHGKYLHITGNGTEVNDRSNAHALDWNGNAYYAGDVYVTGDGKNDFAGAKKLATESSVEAVRSSIPTKVSALTNDSGYLTEHQSLAGYATEDYVIEFVQDEVGMAAAISAQNVTTSISTHNTNESAHNDIRDLISGLSTRLNALADSDDTTLDQMSEIVAYIKANKSLIDSVTTSKINTADIVDNLTTNVATKPLSAAQGVALKTLIDEFECANSNIVNGSAARSLRTTSAYDNLGTYAFGEGLNTEASGMASHAAGSATVASGDFSYAGGNFTVADRQCMTAIGKSNLGTSGDLWSLETSSFNTMVSINKTYVASSVPPTFSPTEGTFAWPNSSTKPALNCSGSYIYYTATSYVFVQSVKPNTGNTNTVQLTGIRYDIIDQRTRPGELLFVVGNGASSNDRSNAHTLDWSGNAWFSGDIYVGSTSGVNKDEGSKKLATEDFVTAALTALGLPVPTVADAGKILRVNAQGKYELVSIANAEEATF